MQYFHNVHCQKIFQRQRGRQGQNQHAATSKPAKRGRRGAGKAQMHSDVEDDEVDFYDLVVRGRLGEREGKPRQCFGPGCTKWVRERGKKKERMN